MLELGIELNYFHWAVSFNMIDMWIFVFEQQKSEATELYGVYKIELSNGKVPPVLALAFWHQHPSLWPPITGSSGKARIF